MFEEIGQIFDSDDGLAIAIVVITILAIVVGVATA